MSRFEKAVTKTRPALQPEKSSFNSLRRFPSTGPALATASISGPQDKTGVAGRVINSICAVL